MPRTILIADETPIMLKAFELAFRKQPDCQVVCVSDGEAALETSRATMPGAIFCSVGLGKLDGYEICQTIKADPILKIIPVVLMHFDPLDAARAAAAGMDCDLPLPFQMAQLNEVLNRCFPNEPFAPFPEPKGCLPSVLGALFRK